MSNKLYIKYADKHKIIDNVELKWCKRCDKWFPMNTEYFKVHPSKKDGYSDMCNKCQEEHNHENYMKNRDEQIKKSRQYQLAHPEQTKKTKSDWNLRNLDIQHERYRIWHENNKEHTNKYRDEWFAKNPYKFAEYSKKRMIKNHKINKTEWLKCKNYFNNSCAYCGLHISEHYFTRKGITKLGDLHKEHADHNGSDDLSNCIPSCGSCNDKKWKFEFEEWYNKDNPIYSEDRYNKIMDWITEDYKQYIEEPKPKGKYVRKIRT